VIVGFHHFKVNCQQNIKRCTSTPQNSQILPGHMYVDGQKQQGFF
jgi:hypothetical protein